MFILCFISGQVKENCLTRVGARHPFTGHPAMFRREIRGSGQTRSNDISASRTILVCVDGFAQILSETPLDHNSFANVSQSVGDGSGWCVTPEYVAHMLSGCTIAGYVCKVPENQNKNTLALKC